MKKTLLAVLCMAGMVSAASAVGIVDTDFTAPYSDGNLANQQGWVVMPGGGLKAFSVDATVGVADSAPFAADFSTNGNYVYLSTISLGNVVDDEWTGSQDFTLSTSAFAGTNVAMLGTQDFYDIGLASTTTNGLNSADDVYIHLRHHDSGTVWVTLSKSGRFRTLGVLTDAEMGWDPANSSAPDFATDKLNLSWTIRKTRENNIFSAVAVLSNTVTGVASVFDPDFHAPDENLNYFVNTNSYTALSMVLAIGHAGDAANGGSSSMIDVAIDTLKVDQTSGNAPVLAAPVLSASSGNALVDLSWTLSVEATSYEVKRSTISGSGYATLATITTNAYTDTSVVNDTTYYYIVTAKETDAADVDSNEVVGEPQAAATGSILNTSFTAGEGYADSTDLAGQDRWIAVPGLKAFQVTDATGNGFADSEPYTNDFDTVLGNNIYYNRLMSNNVGDEWTSSVVFQLKTTPSDGQVLERIIDGTNYSYTVAANAANELFKIGLTIDSATGLEFNDAGDIFVVVRSQLGGRLDFQLNSTANLVNRFGVLGNTEAGWDPNWENDVAAGPDFQTDPITMNFTLRKAASPAGTYTIQGEVICNGITNSSSMVHEYAGSTDAYDAGLVYLSMGIDEEANERKALVATNGLAVGDSYEGAPVTVAIDSISLTKADDQPPTLIVPANLASDVADGAVILEWDASVEATSYTVRRYTDITGGSSIVLASGLADLTYTDSGLVNGTTYFYTISADYGVYGEAETDRLPVRPLGKTTVASWGYGVLVPNESRLNFNMTDATVGAVINSIGGATGGGFYEASDTVAELAPVLYGFMQLETEGLGEYYVQRQIDNDKPYNRYKLNPKNGTQIGSSLGYIDVADFANGTALNLTGSSIYAMEAQVFNLGVIVGSGVHFAIRNGTQWYASETVFPDGGTVVVGDMAAEKWTLFTPATLTSTAMVTVAGQSYEVVPNLNNVNGFGIFVDRSDLVEVEGIKITAGEQATALQLWTDGFGIYNADADAEADPDADGALNVYEWGLGGDPVDPNNMGFPPEFAGMDASGTNLVYVYPRMKSEPRPVYTPMELSDLIYDKPWKDRSSTYTVTVGGDWPGSGGGFEAVTNVVPTDLDTKYISLNITE